MSVKALFKTENIISVKPEDTLAHALSLLSSSHDSAFVVENKQLLGLINPYYCIIKKSYPANTKIKHCLIHPPKIDINDSIKKIVQIMIESKVHYLPVLSQNEFTGIISARRILKTIQDLPALNVPIETIIKHKKPPICILESEFLSKAIAIFKKYKISKLVVTSKDNKVKGILAYYDLIAFLASPKKKEHQGAREGNKSPLLRQPVKKYMRSTVLTVTPKDTLSHAAHLILEKKIGSVVVIDPKRYPIALITTRDFLQQYVQKTEAPQIEVIARDLSRESQKVVRTFLHFFSNRLEKKGVPHAKVVIKQKKERGVFEAIVSFIDGRKHFKRIQEEGKNLQKILEDVGEKTKG